ncbi:hypothetical protein MUK42_06880 [Musa troglodytarum]|uniref:Uncharacterized protein n=1 Tax=Musa troglodytarum TaxID=320322 RepID=A0A9E7HMD9_9LILI|nr:hypothetical protein MUK42_06880 [Musa troglodytarum]
MAPPKKSKKPKRKAKDPSKIGDRSNAAHVELKAGDTEWWYTFWHKNGGSPGCSSTKPMGELDEMKVHAKEMVRLLKKGMKKVKTSCKKGWRKAKNAAATWKKLPSPIKKKLVKKGKQSFYE